MRKLNIHNVTELVAFANRSGMMPGSAQTETIVSLPNGMRIVERRRHPRLESSNDVAKPKQQPIRATG
jgi:hypothetical protein